MVGAPNQRRRLSSFKLASAPIILRYLVAKYEEWRIDQRCSRLGQYNSVTIST